MRARQSWPRTRLPIPMRLHACSLFAATCLIAALPLAQPALAAAPPAQPADGPGGIGDKSAAVTKRAVGTASAATFAFYKTGEAPPEGRPVAIFLHAWGATNPRVYGGWIDHLSRQGWLVLFPRFQEFNRTRPSDATAQAGRLVKAAFEALAGDADAKPDTSRVALIGHLAGAPLAANLAANARAEGFPAPKLVFAVNPGGIARDAKSRGIPLGDLSTIHSDTLVLTLIGDRDTRAADLAARKILRDASAVGQERKLFLRALSDDHGFPAMTSTLTAPAGIDPAYDSSTITVPPDAAGQPKPPFKWSPDMALSGEQSILVGQINNARTDALDYLAYWKTFDIAATAAFAGRDASKLKNDPAFSDMLRWADGWPVKRLSVEVPRAAPTTAPAPAEAPPAASDGRRRPTSLQR